MKKILLASMVSSLLIGCGGGSSEKAETKTSETNEVVAGIKPENIISTGPEIITSTGAVIDPSEFIPEKEIIDENILEIARNVENDHKTPLANTIKLCTMDNVTCEYEFGTLAVGYTIDSDSKNNPTSTLTYIIYPHLEYVHGFARSYEVSAQDGYQVEASLTVNKCADTDCNKEEVIKSDLPSTIADSNWIQGYDSSVMGISDLENIKSANATMKLYDSNHLFIEEFNLEVDNQEFFENAYNVFKYVAQEVQ